jgi:predicted phage terminase large subunit-like protein
MAMMGLRLGKAPQVVWTTTPRPVELVRKLIVPKPGRVVVSGSTFDNKDNLPDRFFEQLEQYEGTTLGRQELYGEMINPEEQGVIKRSWLKLWPAKKPLPAFDWIIMSLDTAFTEATRDTKSGNADYTACSVWGTFQHDEKGYALLLDCWQEQLGMPDLIKRVKKEMNTAYGDDQDVALVKPMFGSAKPLTSGRKPDILLIEDKGSGISLRQMLEREGILAHAYNPGRADKLTRLHVVSPVFARRRVFLPESDKFPGKARAWADPLVAQLCSFTGKNSIKHDDFVDSTTQAMRLMMDKGLLGSLVDKKQEVDKPPPKVIQNPYGQ